MSTIKGAEYPLYKVLSSDFEFHIPDYQRPYAWTREQASELFDEEWGQEFDKFVREPGAKALKLAPKPRLFPRKKDQAFFEKYVQTPGGFPDLLTQDVGKLSEPRRNMVENAGHFDERLAELSVDAIGELGQFIVNNCYIVVVTTDSFHAA